MDAENTEDLEDFESVFINLSTLQSATANFDESNRLGEGGFGVVFKVYFCVPFISPPFKMGKNSVYFDTEEIEKFYGP